MVTDFEVGTDRLDVGALSFVAWAQEGADTVLLHFAQNQLGYVAILRGVDGARLSASDFISSDPGFALVTAIDGTADDDVLAGTGNNDLMRGFAGDDTFTGSPGRDFMFGGAGGDTVEYSGSSGAVDIDLENGGGARSQRGGDAQGDRLFSIEH